MSLNPIDIERHYYWPEDAAKSSWLNLPDYGVELIHKPTNLRATCHTHRNRLRNEVIAMGMLEELVEHRKLYLKGQKK